MDVIAWIVYSIKTMISNQVCKCNQMMTFSDLTLVTLDHKTSHKGKFFEIEIYASYESLINELSIDVWFVRIGYYLTEIQLFENHL